MAIPTIINIVPPEAPTSGRKIIEIYGSNFRQLSPLNSNFPPFEPAPPSVEVLFGDEPATEVQIIRSNLLRVLPPISPIPATESSNYGSGTVDVTVRNIDDSGIAIPGEEVILADGFEYKHPGLDSVTSSELAMLVTALIKDMRKQIIPNVLLGQHTEYDSDSTDSYNITDVGKLPAIVLTGPEIPENRFYSYNYSESVPASDNNTYEVRHPYTVDVKFGVVGITDLKHVLLNLMSHFTTYMRRNKFFRMLRCPDDPSQGIIEYELDFDVDGDLRARTRANNSNIQSFVGSIILRGFNVEGFAGFDLDEVIQINNDIDIIDITISQTS